MLCKRLTEWCAVAQQTLKDLERAYTNFFAREHHPRRPPEPVAVAAAVAVPRLRLRGTR